MEFRIADTFTASLGRLTNAERKATKLTAMDLQLDPAGNGLQFHKLAKAKDPNFWSVRVNDDLRIIVHRSGKSLLLCYADHHDAAYAWAERRRLERHPTTGAAQLVEIREVVAVEATTVPPARVATPAKAKRPPVLAHVTRDALLGYGVPADWVDAVLAVDEDGLFELASHLPKEAMEALLELATGGTPAPAVVAPADADPFAHPDAQRRFRVVDNVEELERALEAPWATWAVFLHPAQRQLVERRFTGPARVAGSAGTGKTIVALHRAVHLARRDPAAKVLLTTFSKALANALDERLALLVGNEPAVAARITVAPLSALAHDLHTTSFGQPNLAPEAVIRTLLAQAAKATPGQTFTPAFLFGEWSDVVDAWQVESVDAYRDVPRIGRKTRLGAKQREQLWSIFEQVHAGLAERKMTTWPALYARLTRQFASGATAPFTHAVVDEAQDLSVAEARFLAALAGGRADALFLAGDMGQRIFQQPFSWKALGLDVRGRSTTLRVNYRTSHQIRSHADRLLPGSVVDVDGIADSRRGTVSVFDGAAPVVLVLADEAAERGAVAGWLKERIAAGCRPEEMALFVRSEAELKRARAAVKAAGLSFAELSGRSGAAEGSVAIGTMHAAKGLEFRAVAVMACDEDVLPLQSRIENVADEGDLEEAYDTERHLLYVACTRARDHLLLTGAEPGSEFLGDMHN